MKLKYKCNYKREENKTKKLKKNNEMMGDRLKKVKKELFVPKVFILSQAATVLVAFGVYVLYEFLNRRKKKVCKLTFMGMKLWP